MIFILHFLLVIMCQIIFELRNKRISWFTFIANIILSHVPDFQPQIINLWVTSYDLWSSCVPVKYSFVESDIISIDWFFQIILNTQIPCFDWIFWRINGLHWWAFWYIIPIHSSCLDFSRFKITVLKIEPIRLGRPF